MCPIPPLKVIKQTTGHGSAHTHSGSRVLRPSSAGTGPERQSAPRWGVSGAVLTRLEMNTENLTSALFNWCHAVVTGLLSHAAATGFLMAIASSDLLAAHTTWLLQKRSDGSISPLSKLLFWPYHLGLRGKLYIQVRQDSQHSQWQCINQVLLLLVLLVAAVPGSALHG